jgi:DNA-binding NarL/FixJ family response regulator
MNKIKVVLADDHQMFLDGLSSLLMQLPDVEVVATVNHGGQLMDILKTQEADLAIVDMHMPVMNGLETTKAISSRYPDIKVLGLTMDNDMDSIKDMLEAGASGYILKNTGKAELELAIHQIINGGTYLSQSVSNQIAQSLLLKRKPERAETEELDMLTEREIEIIKLIAQENSNMDIAEKLYISPKTVETHRKNLMKKIGVKNSLGIYKFAVKNKLLL